MNAFWKISISVLLSLVLTFLVLYHRQPPSKRQTESIKKPQKEETPKNIPQTFAKPTLAIIFGKDHTWTATLSAEHKRVLLATGDVIPARVVNIQTTKFNNFTWPYEKTVDIVKDADVTFINLETPLLKNCPIINVGFTFCGNARNIEGLTYAGVDVASLANNHAGNFGKEGVDETVRLLSDNGILVTGVDGPVVKNVDGVTFAFLGYNDIGGSQAGISHTNEEKIRADIAQARREADIVVVTYHWGIEYQPQPDERQKHLGHLTIDAGADLVIGNHPHWIEPIEFYKGKLITYAHGNYVFDQMWSEETKKGVLGRYTFYDTDLVDVEYFPIYIENFGQPRFMTDVEKQKTLEKMREESNKLLSK